MTIWPKIPLGELCPSRATTVDPVKAPDRNFLYIDIASIDVTVKAITGARWVAGRDAPSRARRQVLTGDVILSMTRPNLNAVALVEPEHSGQVCSTGFCVLRPGPRLDGRYLFHVVQAKKFVDTLSSLVSGAMYPAVTESEVRHVCIPLPPLEEQRRIGSMLNRVLNVRRLRRKAQYTVQKIIPALFNEMFGEPRRNPMGWEVKQFGDIVSGFEGGRSLRADGESIDSPGFRILKLNAVTSGEFIPSASKSAPVEYAPDPRHIVKDGDMLITRSNTADLVGASCLVTRPPPNLLLPDLIWRVLWRNPSPVHPEFLLAALQHPDIRGQISALATGTSDSMRKISQGRLATLSLPVPPLNHQAKFVALANVSHNIRRRHSLGVSQEEALISGLQAKLFV